MAVNVQLEPIYNADLKIVNSRCATKLLFVFLIEHEHLVPDVSEDEIERYLQFRSQFPLLTPTQHQFMDLSINTISNDRLKVSLKGKFLNHLYASLGKSLTLKITLSRFQEMTFIHEYRDTGELRGKQLQNQRIDPYITLTTTDMKPQKCAITDHILFEDVFLLDKFQPFGQHWSTSKFKRYSIDITMVARCSLADQRFTLENSSLQPSVTNLADFTKKLLTDKTGADVVLVHGNQKEIQCHKLFLAANSAVFQKMFQEDKFKQKETSRIEIKNMSETGINALLDFLYCLNVSPAVKSFDVAMELLEASEKYSFKNLKSAMKKNFISVAKDDWYPNDRDGVFRLFRFSRSATNCEDLKKKAVEILKSKPKSSEFDQILAKYPAAAVELCRDLLKSEQAEDEVAFVY